MVAHRATRARHADLKIANLASMGFDREKCKQALLVNAGDEAAAAEWILSHP